MTWTVRRILFKLVSYNISSTVTNFNPFLLWIRYSCILANISSSVEAVPARGQFDQLIAHRPVSVVPSGVLIPADSGRRDVWNGAIHLPDKWPHYWYKSWQMPALGLHIRHEWRNNLIQYSRRRPISPHSEQFSSPKWAYLDVETISSSCSPFSYKQPYEWGYKPHNKLTQ